MDQTDYQSYLLRLWQTRDGECTVWHASLEHPDSRVRQGFAELDDLFDYIRAQTEPPTGRDWAVHNKT
jgi:hypothetical protein